MDDNNILERISVQRTDRGSRGTLTYRGHGRWYGPWRVRQLFMNNLFSNIFRVSIHDITNDRITCKDTVVLPGILHFRSNLGSID